MVGEQGYSDVNYPTKKVWKNTGYEYDLVLTNKEVRLMFQQMVKSWFSGIKISYNEFIKALLAGDFMRKKKQIRISNLHGLHYIFVYQVKNKR